MERTPEIDDRGDRLKAAGGILLAVGALILFIRKEGPWDDFPLLLVIGVPFVLLYWLGAVGNPADPAGRDRASRADGIDLPARDRGGWSHGRGLTRWQSALLVTAVLLSVLFFSRLMETIGLDTDKDIVNFLVFALIAGVAAYAAFALGAAYQALLAALAGIGAWLSLWSALLGEPSVTTQRWLLLVLAAGYLAVAVSLHGAGARQAPELVTAAGIVAVAAGLVGLLVGAVASLGGLFGSGSTGAGNGGQGFFWDLFLLVVSLVLVLYGTWGHARGPAYVGAVGLLAFAIVQGTELNALLEQESSDQAVVGWPLALLLIGAAALAAGLFARTPPTAGAGVPAEPAPLAPSSSGQAAPPRDEV